MIIQFLPFLKDEEKIFGKKTTPEILIKIQERDKKRKEKREQIRSNILIDKLVNEQIG